jgi:hypothetical protein
MNFIYSDIEVLKKSFCMKKSRVIIRKACSFAKEVLYTGSKLCSDDDGRRIPEGYLQLLI